MQVLRDPSIWPRPEQGTVVTIGAYDGVHRGHVAVIEWVRRLAAERGFATAVVTFDRHPASVVRPESAPCLLTDLDQKLALLEQTGVDYTLVIQFDQDRANEAAEDFVRVDLVGNLNAKVIVVGEDFHFGHQRRGNVALLREMGAEIGFEVSPLALVGMDGEPAGDDDDKVSSTAIRALLQAGDLQRAHELLGREYEVRGVVGHGDKRARDLGFPTANVNVPDGMCLPADGIYAGWYVRESAAVDGVEPPPLPCAISLGRRPTFYESQPYSLLEAHLLDFDDSLYGEVARVRFSHRLRDELKFDSVESLIEQMHADVAKTRTLLLA